MHRAIASISILLLCSGATALRELTSQGERATVNEDRIEEAGRGEEKLQSRGGEFFTCAASSYETVEGIDRGSTQRILHGLAEWLQLIRDGMWGDWLKDRLVALEQHWLQGHRGLLLLQDGADANQAVLPQVFEAWKLMKIVFLQYAPELLAGHRVDGYTFLPELIAAFSEDGTMQAVGKVQYEESKSEVYFPLAVTRYTLSYAAKDSGQAGAEKGAGRALLAGWIEERIMDLNRDMVLYTFPASAFVRKLYMKNGALSACTGMNDKTDDECGRMAEADQNCDCDVRMCVKAKCIMYFELGICNSASLTDMFTGWTKGCYSASTTATFAGSCPLKV